AARLRCRRRSLKLRKMGEKCALLLGYPLRCPELCPDVKVSHARPVHARQAATPKVEHLSALRGRRYTDRDRAVHGGRLHVPAKYQRGVRHQHLGVQVLAVTLEPFVFLHLEHHYNVPTRAAAWAGVPHPAKRHVLTRGYSSRY